MCVCLCVCARVHVCSRFRARVCIRVRVCDCNMKAMSTLKSTPVPNLTASIDRVLFLDTVGSALGRRRLAHLGRGCDVVIVRVK